MTLRARVRNGRLTIDEPTNLPEGAEVTLVVTPDDELDEGERARLHAALLASEAEWAEGGVPAAEVIARLRRSRT